ncbi:MAG TPA: response regulator [Rickettsiales bacterium]|nr:response regulator [Rickettsiales bacterium]
MTGIPLKRILLVEDSKSDVLLIKRNLRNALFGEPIEVIDVPRMADALEQIKEKAFDLIILDLSLPDIEGSASVAALSAYARSVPVIVHTGTQSMKAKEEAIMCGARQFLIKDKESPLSFRLRIQQALENA